MWKLNPKKDRRFIMITLFIIVVSGILYFGMPTQTYACDCPGYASFGDTTCGGSNACGAGLQCTIACFDGDKNGDGIGDGPCSGCTPAPQPPPPVGGPPPPPGGWGGCGSCSTCMGGNPSQCQLDSSTGICHWNPTDCGGGGGSCTPSYPGAPTLVSPPHQSTVVGVIGGSIRFDWTLAGWGRGCPNVDNGRFLYGIKTKPTCDYSQMTWSSGGLQGLTSINRPVTGADPYLKLNTTYCWQVSQHNGTFTNYSAVREVTIIPSVTINSAAFATPTKCGGVRISGSAQYADTNNPITYSIDVSHPLNNFAGGVNYLKEVNLGMVPSTTMNGVTATSAVTEPNLRNYVGFKVTGLGTFPNNIQYMSADNAAVPVWANPRSSGNLTNATNRATLLGLGTQTTVTQVNNTTLRITFTIRYEDTFPTVPVLNAYVMAVMTQGGVDYSQNVVGNNRFYYARFDNWRTDLLSPAVSVVGPTVTAVTTPPTFRITWNASDTSTGNTGISQFSGTCQTNSGTGGPTANPWTALTAGGTARKNAVTVENNNLIYTWGGCNDTTTGCTAPLNTMDVYNITTGAWTTAAPGGFGRYGAAGQVYNNKIYIWGGYTGTGYSSRMDIYDIATNTWSSGLAGGSGRYLISSGIYNGRIYYFGGHNGTAYTGTTSIYNIATNTWSTGAVGPVTAATNAVLHDNKFYIWGGYNGSAIVNTVRIYDPVANTWSSGTSGGTARWLVHPVVDNGKIYAYGGCTATTCVPASISKTLDIYDIASGTWTVGVNPGLTPRTALRMVVKSGKIYAVKGAEIYNGSLPVNTIDVYDIAAGDVAIASGTIVNLTQTSAPVTSFQLVNNVESQCLFVADYSNEGLLGIKLYRQDSSNTWDGITVRLSAIDGACNAPVSTVSQDSADPWTMVRYGVASAGLGFRGFTIPEINMNTLYPATWGDEAFLSGHSTIAGNNRMLNYRQSVGQTYTTDYKDLNTDPANIIGMSTWYDTIDKILTDRYPTGITNLTANTVPATLNAYPAGQTVFLRYTPAGGTLSTTNTGTNFNCTRPAIILVNGNLNIHPQMTFTGDANKCVWVVKGNVTINPGTDLNPISGGVGTNSDTLRGNVIITDGTFNVLADPVSGTSYADSLWAWPVIAKEMTLGRDLGGYWNSRYPSEFFQFDPSILYFLSDELAVTKFSIRPR